MKVIKVRFLKNSKGFEGHASCQRAGIKFLVFSKVQNQPSRINLENVQRSILNRLF